MENSEQFINDTLMEMFQTENISGIKEMVKKGNLFLENKLNQNSPFIIFLVENGKVELIDYFYQNGLNLKSENDYFLAVAATEGQNSMVEYLLDKGLNINILLNISNSSYTPLDLSIRHNQPSTAKILIERGADPSIGNYKSLRHCLIEKYTDLLIEIVEKNKIDISQPYLKTTLIEGSIKNSDLKLLLYINEKLKKKKIIFSNEVMAFCARFKSDKILSYLLSSGANPENGLKSKTVKLNPEEVKFLQPFICIYKEKTELYKTELNNKVIKKIKL